ncbi:hypothetical protein [Helicobacter sp. 23-1045]
MDFWGFILGAIFATILPLLFVFSDKLLKGNSAQRLKGWTIIVFVGIAIALPIVWVIISSSGDGNVAAFGLIFSLFAMPIISWVGVIIANILYFIARRI